MPNATGSVPFAMAVVDTHVIPREERYLELPFGDVCRSYRERVSRWL